MAAGHAPQRADLFLSRPPLDFGRILDSIALLRLVNPRTPLRFAGRRRLLTDLEKYDGEIDESQEAQDCASSESWG